MLRKYLPALCILEAIAIASLLGYLYVRNPSSKSTNSAFNYPSGSQVESPIGTYRTYSSGGRSSRFLVGLVDGCNQRIHDLNSSIKCESSKIESCRSLGSLDFHPPESHFATVVTTSKAGARLETRKTALKRIDCQASRKSRLESPCRFKTQLHVFLAEEEQEIIGWGGAMSDSSISNILSLTMNGTRQLLDDYFGFEGLMFNMLRITIGGSDFSSRFYTNDDLSVHDSDDISLDRFKLREEDIMNKIPILKFIQDTYRIENRQMKLFASMWSPPVWMKTNGHFNKGYLKGSIGPLQDPKDELYFKALAELKKKFILAYQDNGLQFWALTVMNEPIFAQQPFIDFNTMIFPMESYGHYITKYLGPTIKGDKRLSHIKLIVHDDNRKFLMNYTDPVLSMPGVRQYVDGISVHGYIDEQYSLMKQIYLKHKLNDTNFFVLPTELCSAHLPFMEKALVGNWHRGIHYALDIIRSLQNVAAGWVDWNMALDTKGGPGWLGGRLDSPIIVDKARDAYHKSPMYYVLGQFSRYIPPGSIKLKTVMVNAAYDYHYETVTFSLPNRKTLVTVILNNNPYSIELNIRLISSKRTSEKLEPSSLYQISCEADSVTTLVYSRDIAENVI